MKYRQTLFVLLPLSIVIASGCSSSDSDSDPDADSGPTTVSDLAGLETLGPITEQEFAASTDGLLAGLGLSGIQTAPEFYADSDNPVSSELRRNAIQANYTALVDQSEAGGFGVLYGPTDDTTYPGKEYHAYIGSGLNRATLMVQIPDSFDTENPCVVAAPSSGSRGVYGAIGTGGAWGLEHNCAVAYTDANKGTGAVELTQNIGFDIHLKAVDLGSTNEEATFVVPTVASITDVDAEYGGVALPSQAALEEYIESNPNRYAFKHAHSQKNIEKDWGKHTIESVKFAFKQLNAQLQGEFTPDNTIVIGASVSNGGAAVLRAVEQDTESLFDGVVAGEPNINPQTANTAFSIQMGTRAAVVNHSKPAYEYFIAAELYAGCASKSASNAGALFAELRGDTQARCDALLEAGLLDPGTAEELGAQATLKLIDAGYLSESSKLLVGYSGIDLFQSLLGTYGNAYTRSSVVDSLCNVSMAHVAAGETTPSARASLATLAAISNGIPRTSDIYLIKDDSPSGATIQIAATSSNSAADYNFEGALCWKDLLDNTENPLNERLIQGIEEIKGTGNLQETPVIIVHGRDDALIPVNNSSRPYYVLNQQQEGDASNLYYYEIKNAQHLDSLNQLYASVEMNYVPIDYYFKQALDLMYEHLTSGSSLPPSQVVQTIAPIGDLKDTDLVAISTLPDGLISYSNNTLTIPE